jgi:metallophosphoesterase superfamily enzyme
MSTEVAASNTSSARPTIETPGGVRVCLLPGRAVLLEGQGGEPWLVVADVHLGKSATFRARGLAVPEGDTAQDLAGLLQLARRHLPGRVVVNGDLFHAPAGITPELEAAVSAFVEELGVPLTLVTGNHDAKIRHLPAGVESVLFLDYPGDVRLVHDPAEAVSECRAEADTVADISPAPNLRAKPEAGAQPASRRFYLTGHWHPVVRIADGKRTSLRLPCFLLRGGQNLILPSFGSFTGGAIMKPEPGDRFFVSPGDRVIEVPGALLR